MNLLLTVALLLLGAACVAVAFTFPSSTTVVQRVIAVNGGEAVRGHQRWRMNQEGLESDNTLPPRVVLQPLPRLYLYDHCPFCARVRLALGLKNIKHELFFMANDDVDTPTRLVGKKIAPIFEVKAKNILMPESLDIIARIDSDPDFGPINQFAPASHRQDLRNWQAKYTELTHLLQRPRYMQTLLPEFSTRDAKDAYIRNHPLPPYEKAFWKEQLAAEQRWALYNEGFVVSLKLKDEAATALKELDDLIYCEDYCTEGGFCLDDIELWARLRSMTLVKGLVFPTKLQRYMENLSKKADVPLYFALAC
eukprot:gene5888-6483_t